MAWITEKHSRAFLVRWRDERGKAHSRQFKTREEAEAYKQEHEQSRRERALGAGPDVTDDAFGVARFNFDKNRWEMPDGTPWRGQGGPIIDPEAVDPRYAFENYLRKIIDDDVELRPGTRELYLRNIRVHISGTPLARADIRTISPEMLTDYWSRLNAGIGARRNVQQLLSKAFNRAVQVGDIDVSPLKRAPTVKRPSKTRREEVEPLTVVEIEKLADAAKNPRDRLEILVMAYGGLRAGEVGGLRVKDVDIERCRLQLRQQVTRVTGRGAFVAPVKTNAGRRTVTIPCSVIEELTTFLEEEPPAKDGRVFHGPNGELRAHNAINHNVSSTAKRIGLDVNAHQLRHTAVSLWIDDGANPVDVQRMVGHSDIRMTLGTYGHLFTHGGAALADSMERRRDAYRNGRDTR